MATLAFRIAEIERRLANLARIGVVSEIDVGAARVRVEIGSLKTGWIPWLTQRAGDVKTWDAPTAGEQVLVVSPGGDLGLGVAMPAIYRASYGPPASVETLHRTEYADGTVIEYDRAAHKLKATVVGSAEVTADTEIKATAPTIKLEASTKITLQAPLIEVQGQLTQTGGTQTMTGNMTINGTVTVQGVVTASGDVSANGISLQGHRHGGVTSGGAQTGVPNP